MSLAGKLQRFLDKHGVHYHEGNRSFVTSCLSPACGKEDHCYIRKSDGRTICFRCGRKWNWKRMVSAIVSCSLEEAYGAFFGTGAGEEIVKPLDITQLFGSEDEDEDEEEPLASIALGPDFVDAGLVTRALEYLIKRGITSADLISQYDLKYHAQMDAVVFPVKKENVLYGWQARRIDPKEGELRLISHRNFQKSHFLLNYDRAKSFDRVVIAEGPFDCMHCELEQVTGVASFGKNVSLEQIKLLLDLPAQNIYLGLDPDATDEVYDILGKVGFGKRLYRIWPPKHRKDFGECTKEEMAEAITKAIAITCQADVLDVHLK
jgi:hypothetical protein